jgi:hypothetical protein
MIQVVAEDGHEPTHEELAAAAECVMRELAGEISEYIAAMEREQTRLAVRFRAAVAPSRN